MTHAEPHLRSGGEAGSYRRVLGWLAAAAAVILGPTEASVQRQDIIRRAVIAGALIAVLPIEAVRFPGWEGVAVACVAVLLYDVALAYFVFVKQRFFLERVLGSFLDAVVLMSASFYVFYEMGAVGSTSSIWLVFVVYIIIGGFTFAPVGSLAYTALWTGWFALGTLMFFSQGSLYYDDLPMRLVFLALIGVISLGMASELQKHRRRLEQQNRETMGMLATLVEARDTDAGAHLKSIQHISRALALHLGYTDQEAQEIAYASMMHDVGKANLPDSILQNTGPLSEEEWAVMRSHTVWGDELLAENDDFELARIVARSHHEHWDGSGYPDGLAGEDIPVAARIVAVADVYDALISERPYKAAWSPEDAIQEIQRIAGSHLDACIVEAFVELWGIGGVRRPAQQAPADAAASAPLDRVDQAA
ncbi:MAG: HD domain-containing protein [Chloroflexi bacterium]|nr:HD domain-containing protein [Chloroflexota bacterium]